nr:transglutaminase domain-containing protein [Actinomycetes bacterium]
LEFALRFFQAIPYNTLENRDREGIAGFVSPYALIDQNEGDCDTKTTAIASVLVEMWPDVDVIMLLIPEHALLGISLPARADDATIGWNNKTFVLLEPVGPGLFPVGRIGERSEKAINNNEVESVIQISRT